MKSSALYILGMAKSALDLRGAKSRNLRLDVELLASGIGELEDRGHQALGYVLVLSETVARRVESWCVSRPIEVIVANLPPDTLAAVQEEKARNARGIASGKREDSIAALGREVGESELLREIRARHPSVRPCSERPPGGIRWDFFGVA